MKKSAKTVLAAALFSLGLTGCASNPFQNKPVEGLTFEKMPVTKDSDGVLGSKKMKAIEYRGGKNQYFSLEGVNNSEDIPDIDIKGFSVNNASPFDTVRLLLVGTGINAFMSDKVSRKDGVYISEANGKLKDILQYIADSSGLYFEYKNNSLVFSEKKSFSIKVPPMMSEDSVTAFGESLTSLGVEDVKVDGFMNMVSFKSKVEHLDAVKKYIDNAASTKSVVVYDTWIWEVSLNDDSSAGINWENLRVGALGSNFGLKGGASLDSNSGLMGTMKYEGDGLNLGMLVSFLKQHGKLQTLSQPQIAALSGTKSTFEVGENEEYTSELSFNVSSTGDSTSTTSTTKVLETGLKIDIATFYDDGTVWSDLKLVVEDLVTFNRQEISGTVLRQPKTVDRKLSAMSRVQPGEYFILGGVNMERMENNRDGFALTDDYSVPYSKANKKEKVELVIVMRPRVVVFGEEPKKEAK